MKTTKRVYAPRPTDSDIRQSPASGPGALPGFEVECRVCGDVASFSLLPIAQTHAEDHFAFMANREHRR